eukprot:Rmarinus@m.9162
METALVPLVNVVGVWNRRHVPEADFGNIRVLNAWKAAPNAASRNELRVQFVKGVYEDARVRGDLDAQRQMLNDKLYPEENLRKTLAEWGEKSEDPPQPNVRHPTDVDAANIRKERLRKKTIGADDPRTTPGETKRSKTSKKGQKRAHNGICPPVAVADDNIPRVDNTPQVEEQGKVRTGDDVPLHATPQEMTRDDPWRTCCESLHEGYLQMQKLFANVGAHASLFSDPGSSINLLFDQAVSTLYA